MTVEALVARYGEDAPWIQQTWQYLEDNNVLISVGEIGSGNSGAFKDRCSSPDPMSGLNVCTTDFVEFDDPTSEDVVVHELAHVYYIDNYVLGDHPEKATGIAIALIYLDTLQQLDPAWLCNKYEFLADLMTIRSMGDLATPGYWGECETTPHTDKALEIVNSALAGRDPVATAGMVSVMNQPSESTPWRPPLLRSSSTGCWNTSTSRGSSIDHLLTPLRVNPSVIIGWLEKEVARREPTHIDDSDDSQAFQRQRSRPGCVSREVIAG